MKKFFLLAAVFFMAAVGANAQEKSELQRNVILTGSREAGLTRLTRTIISLSVKSFCLKISNGTALITWC